MAAAFAGATFLVVRVVVIEWVWHIAKSIADARALVCVMMDAGADDTFDDGLNDRIAFLNVALVVGVKLTHIF